MELKHFKRMITRQKKYVDFKAFLPPKNKGIFKILQKVF